MLGAGAYELFLEIGGLVLASAGLMSVVERLQQLVTGKKRRVHSDDQEVRESSDAEEV